MLQDGDHALAQLGAEAFEDEVWIAFGHGAARAVGNVGAQDDVVSVVHISTHESKQEGLGIYLQRKTRRRPMREMTDRHSRRRPAMLMHKHHIAQPAGLRT
jgi:hypothetical protein